MQTRLPTRATGRTQLGTPKHRFQNLYGFMWTLNIFNVIYHRFFPLRRRPILIFIIRRN